MRICADCFCDEELQNFINAEGYPGVCDVTGEKKPTVDIDDLADFFTDLLSIFVSGPTTNDSLYAIIQKDWSFFRDKSVAQKLLNEAISRFGEKINPEHVSYIDEISNYISTWSKLKKDLREHTRYFVNLNNYNPMDPYFEDCISADLLLPKGLSLYRGRLLPDKVLDYKEKDMGCPPAEKVNGGRANPIGIPYLYLCGDEDTILYEIRARYKDRVSIGRFILQTDMYLVDLTSHTSLYLSSHSGDFRKDVKHKLLLNAIANDMSKPLSRYDTELEYVPTQFICELCRLNGADGVCFQSSLYQKGMNYVLFCGNDEDKIKCISVNTHTVEHVEIRI